MHLKYGLSERRHVCCCVSPVEHIRKQQVVNPKKPNSATIGNQPSLKELLNGKFDIVYSCAEQWFSNSSLQNNS